MCSVNGYWMTWSRASSPVQSRYPPSSRSKSSEM
jgi:hypothetical protein